MTNNQRIVLAVFAPLLVLAITYGIAEHAFDIMQKCPYVDTVECRMWLRTLSVANVNIHALDFKHTWSAWAVACAVIGVAEYFLFGLKLKK
ncbi:MAG: hypothetical protein ABH856_01820 [Patescibacteria group bacterium]|nr:hypothetical protein [Patescibacteria group bacterium]